MTDKDEIADLKRELAQVKSAMQPIDHAAMEREAREWMDRMHQARGAHMAHASAFSREDLAAMEAATPTQTVREIAMRDNRAPLGPSVQGVIPSSQPLSNIRTGGGGTGWLPERPLGPQPGINHIDRLLDHADMQDRHERMMEAARQQVLLKAATKP
jgi:hypothetical protein